MASYVVRYGIMRFLGLFSARGNDVYARGQQVIIRSNRGLELGEILAASNEASESQLKEAPGGQVLRQQTPQDSNELAHIHSKERNEFDISRQHVARLGLDMQLVDLEHIFGGERVVVYYLSEDRIDFRELVKALAAEFQTRIEMRQIGVRDEAKLLADYGDCGKPVCCNTHLQEMPPVSMKMAKMQKATLDPTKISGRCGRLKCCLRYEFDTYEELQKEMPPIGSDVVTNIGRARVLGQEILSQQLLISTEDNRRVLVNVSDVLTVLKRGSGQREYGPREPREEAATGSGDDHKRGGRSERPPRGGQGQPRPPRESDKRRDDRAPKNASEQPPPVEASTTEPPPADPAPSASAQPPVPPSPGDRPPETQE